MDHSSIELLEPRWSPARLVAGPLPAEFGATLPSISAEEAQNLVVQLPEIDPLHHGMFPPESGGPFTQATIQINIPVGIVSTGAGTLVLSDPQYDGSLSVAGGTLSMGSAGAISISTGGTLSLYRPGYFSQVLTPDGTLSGTVTILNAGTIIGLAPTVAGFRSTLTLATAPQFVGGGELPAAVLDQLSVAGPFPISGGALFLRPDLVSGSSLVLISSGL